MDIEGKHIAILVDNYFEQAEFEKPIEALREAGGLVTVIGTNQKELQGLNHVTMGNTFTADLLVRDATPEGYDALIIPGGAINADTLRMNEEAQQWAKEFLRAGKPLALICHAPWLLVSADVVDGHRLTGYYTIQDDIVNAGDEWIDEAVVVDRNLITSRMPDDIPAFNRAIITMLTTTSLNEDSGDNEENLN